MPLQSIPLTSAFKQELFDTFKGIDLSLIKDVLYFDNWTTYEESGGVLIFQGIDDSYQYCEFGHCVMVDSSEQNHFEPIDIQYDRAVEMAQEWDEGIKQNEVWWERNS